MREASKRRTVTDTDSYAFIISLTANERMTEANLMGMFKKIIKTTLLLLIILLFPVNSFGEKIKDSGTTNGYKWETISIRKGLCFVGGAQLKVNGKIVVSKKDDISFIVHAERLDNFDGAPYFAISKDTGLFGGTVLSKKSLINCKGEKLPLPEFYTIDPYIDLKGRDGVIFDSRAYIPDEKYYYLNGELIKTKLNNKYDWTYDGTFFNIYDRATGRRVVSSDKLPYTKIKSLKNHDDFIEIYNEKKVGIYNIAHNIEVLKPVYDDITPLCEYESFENADKTLYRATIDNRFGLYNITLPFVELLPYPSVPSYTKIEILKGSNKIVKVYNQQKAGLYSMSKKKEILKPEMDGVEIFDGDNNYIEVIKDYKKGLYDIETGKIVLPTRYSSILDIKENKDGHKVVKVCKNSKYGLYDITRNRELLTPDFDWIEVVPSNNLIIYKLNGLAGVIDFEKKDVIPTNRGYTAIQYVTALNKFTYIMDGYKGECDILGNQISSIVVSQPIKSSNTASASTSSKNQGNNLNHSEKIAGSTTSGTPVQNQGNQVREYIETVPVQVWQPCGACNNSGQCQVCYGQGWTYSNSSYNGKRTCSACHGTGRCTLCGGHGGQNVVRYEQRTVYR